MSNLICAYQTVLIQDQTARSVQSVLDLHCPQKGSESR